MSQNGIGLTETVVFAAQDSQKTYPYRTAMGMIPSAEFSVYMDDFLDSVVTNVPNGWTAAIIDIGATVTVNTTAALGANGVLTLADATASEGAAFYGTKSIQLTAGKKFFMEVKIRTDDVTDNAFQFGLTDLTATTNPEDLWTTVAANVATFGILDGSAVVGMLADKSNAGTAVQAGTISLVANTWTTLAIGYDGSNLQGFVDGKLAVTWATAASIPTGVALAPFVGHLNGNGAGGAVAIIDYVRYVSQR